MLKNQRSDESIFADPSQYEPERKSIMPVFLEKGDKYGQYFIVDSKNEKHGEFYNNRKEGDGTTDEEDYREASEFFAGMVAEHNLRADIHRRVTQMVKELHEAWPPDQFNCVIGDAVVFSLIEQHDMAHHIRSVVCALWNEIPDDDIFKRAFLRR